MYLARARGGRSYPGYHRRKGVPGIIGPGEARGVVITSIRRGVWPGCSPLWPKRASRHTYRLHPHPHSPHSVTNNNTLSRDNKTARIRYACSPCNSMTSAAFSGALRSHAASMPSCPSCSRRALCTLCQPVVHPSPLCAPGPLRTPSRISRGRRVRMPAAVPRGRNSELRARATSCGSRCAQQRSKGHSASAPRLWGATITPSSP